MQNVSEENSEQTSLRGNPSLNTQQQSQVAVGPAGAVQEQAASSSADGCGSTSQTYDVNSLPNQSAPAPPPAIPFDLSSYDPLQVHALQLTVSAGLTTPNQTVTVAQGSGTLSSDSAATQIVNSSQPSQPQVPQQYFYVQNPTTNALQVLLAAPASAAQAPHALVGQAPAVMMPQKYITTGATNAPIPVPSNYGEPSFFTAGNQPTITPSFLQSVMSQTFIAGGFGGQSTLLPAPQSGMERVTAGAAAALARVAREKSAVTTPSVVSSSTSGTNANAMLLHSAQDSTKMGSTNSRKKAPASEAVDDDHEPLTPKEEEKRRHERNLREQQRSLKISQQIQTLRDLLTDSGIPFKPNKFSILYSVADYIKQLQARAIMLDAEHRKLVETIRQANEMVNSGEAQGTSSNESVEEKKGSNIANESELLFVQGLDYRAVFTQCPAALGVAALDGRLLACNNEFEAVLGAPRDELIKMSLFNLMQNHQDVFRAMGEMLKTAGTQINLPAHEMPQMYWSGQILSQRNHNLYMTITLTRDAEGMPKFFNCALATL